MLKRLFFLFLFSCGALLSFGQNTPQGKGKLIIKEEPGIIQLKRMYAEEFARKGVEGYCVQIYNGSRKACEQKRAAFIKLYPEVKVQTVYESPEYKVQVGGFKTKLEAERFLYFLDTSFSGSFVVKTRIFL